MELRIELVKVDLQNKRTETGEDYRQLNPNGYVPFLILDDGNRLFEGPAIVQYLATHGHKKLIPPVGTFQRYQVQQWLNFISTEIHKSFSPLFNSVAPEAAKQYVINILVTRLEMVSERLSSHPFLLGENFSVADAYLFVTLRWGQYVDVDISRWPALVRFSNRISERPAVQQALKEEGLS